MHYIGLKNKYGYDLSDVVLYKGGEGLIYNVTDSDRLAAKIYYPQCRDCTRKSKLESMAVHPNAEQHTHVAWPVDILYDNDTGEFCGYIMRKFSSTQNFSEILDDENLDWKKRAVIAYNLCNVIKEIHGFGQCIGDMNPQNFGVQMDTGFVCAFDADSFHYVNTDYLGRKEVFMCSVGVGNYLAPEIHAQLKSSSGTISSLNQNSSFSKSTDEFALSILIFQLLFFGFHPFHGKQLSSYGSSQAVFNREDNILYKTSPYFNSAPNTAISADSPSLDIIPYSAQEVFIEALIGDSNSRPSAVKWQDVIADILVNLESCNTNSNHFYYSSLPSCPWCNKSNSYPVDGKDKIETISVPSDFLGKDFTLKLVAGDGTPFNAKFPSYLCNGQSVKYNLKGFPGKNGGKSGNYIVTVTCDNPVNGADYATSVKITGREASRGCEKIVECLGKKIVVSIPAGIVNNSVLKIKGMGFSGSSGGTNGDIVVTVEIANNPFISFCEHIREKSVLNILSIIGFILSVAFILYFIFYGLACDDIDFFNIPLWPTHILCVLSCIGIICFILEKFKNLNKVYRSFSSLLVLTVLVIVITPIAIDSIHSEDDKITSSTPTPVYTTSPTYSTPEPSHQATLVTPGPVNQTAPSTAMPTSHPTTADADNNDKIYYNNNGTISKIVTADCTWYYYYDDNGDFDYKIGYWPNPKWKFGEKTTWGNFWSYPCLFDQEWENVIGMDVTFQITDVEEGNPFGKFILYVLEPEVSKTYQNEAEFDVSDKTPVTINATFKKPATVAAICPRPKTKDGTDYSYSSDIAITSISTIDYTY